MRITFSVNVIDSLQQQGSSRFWAASRDYPCGRRVSVLIQTTNSLQNCDLVLQAVEESLDRFERDLGIVSSEIENLQKRSLTISQRLERRDSVEQLLAPSVDELSIPPATVLTLSEGPIDSEWKSALMVLRKRLSTLHQVGTDLESRPAESDLRPLLEDLKNIVSFHICDQKISYNTTVDYRARTRLLCDTNQSLAIS